MTPILLSWFIVTTYADGSLIPAGAVVTYELEILRDGVHLVTYEVARPPVDVAVTQRGPLYTARVRAVVDGVRSQWSAPLELRLPVLTPAVPEGLQQQ